MSKYRPMKSETDGNFTQEAIQRRARRSNAASRTMRLHKRKESRQRDHVHVGRRLPDGLRASRRREQ